MKRSGRSPQTPRTKLPLAGHVAVVTGASRGIGKAIAVALARYGATVAAVGRRASPLTAIAKSLQVTRAFEAFEADLGVIDEVRKLATAIERKWTHVDILVHCAGLHSRGALSQAPIEELDKLYAVNVRGTYLLTQLLLPRLVSRRGQIVFVNSTQGLSATANLGQYAATKHALKAIADSLREEVNADGVRVLTIFPGRTATPGMRLIYEAEKKHYRPGVLLQPDDIAAVVLNALTLPRTAEVTNIYVRPLIKSY